MQKMLIVAFDARVGEVVAVEEIDSINHWEYFVVVWTQGTHLLFKPRMVGEGFAELISILYFDKQVRNVAVSEQLNAFFQCVQLFGVDGECCAGVAFDHKLVGVHLAETSRNITIVADEGVFAESFEPISYLLIINGIKPSIEHFHIAERECHARSLSIDGRIAEEVDGTLHPIIAHNVGVYFKDNLFGVDAVEILAEEDVCLDGRLVGRAKVKASIAVGIIKTGVESAIAMR